METSVLVSKAICIAFRFLSFFFSGIPETVHITRQDKEANRKTYAIFLLQDQQEM